jgi:hypothetical protein
MNRWVGQEVEKKNRERRKGKSMLGADGGNRPGGAAVVLLGLSESQSLGAGGALAKAVPDQYNVYHTANLACNNEIGPDEGLYGNICVPLSALTRSRSTLRATRIQPEVRPRHLSGKVGTRKPMVAI